MRVLVDTSVWIASLDRKSAAFQDSPTLLSSLIASEQNIYVIGLIIFEVVRGFRNTHEYKRLSEALSIFPMLEMKKEDYLYAANLNAVCRSKGIIASTVDTIIATAAIRYDCHLLSSDKDFEKIANVTPLRLLN